MVLNIYVNLSTTRAYTHGFVLIIVLVLMNLEYSK